MGDGKENVHTNRILKTAKNIFGNKLQTPSNGILKLNTVSNTPTNKENQEIKSENKASKNLINSPLEVTTPRANILIDKS